MKIVINSCYGGFALSAEAEKWLYDRGDVNAGRKPILVGGWAQDRAHPLLVECVETLREKANGLFSKLKVIEIPDGVSWEISEHGGNEWVAETHRRWDL